MAFIEKMYNTLTLFDTMYILVFMLLLFVCFHAALWGTSCYAGSGNDTAGNIQYHCHLPIFGCMHFNSVKILNFLVHVLLLGY